MARVLTNREVVQIEDIATAPTHGMKMRLATIKLAKARSLIAVPMLKKNEVIGIIAIYRQEVRSFSEKQVEESVFSTLLENCRCNRSCSTCF
jgi:putative methionine-R-sulfoxide reductase with GAF domain